MEDLAVLLGPRGNSEEQEEGQGQGQGNIAAAVVGLKHVSLAR